jgi:16S rRNA G966 N2-methylase RsmD
LALVDHLLNLRQIGLGRQRDLIFVDPPFVKEHRVQPVQRVSGTGLGDYRTQPT